MSDDNNQQPPSDDSSVPKGRAQFTVVEYVYCDASNYKQYGSIAAPGALNTEEQARLIAACNVGGLSGQFYPEQVGLPALYEAWDSTYDDDHPIHELRSVVVSPTPNRRHDATFASAAQMLEAFETTTWDPAAAEQHLETWRTSVPSGH